MSGTIRKPPPMPKNPEKRPTAKPIPRSNGTSSRAVSRERRTSGLPTELRLRSITAPLFKRSCAQPSSALEQHDAVEFPCRLGHPRRHRILLGLVLGIGRHAHRLERVVIHAFGMEHRSIWRTQSPRARTGLKTLPAN